ncbi:MAG: DUF4383 domain-containing protein [Chloroflexi bacterium]|nr:DUF4383 domain-containing protein [Chloroflexota bacterium]
MDNLRLGRWWMLFAGIALIGAGIIGFVPNNPIASEDPSALFRVNALHNVVHIATGAVALGIGYLLQGSALANGMIWFGLLYAAVLIVTIIDPALFGLFENAPVNAADHVLHAALAIVSVGLGWMARSESPARAM